MNFVLILGFAISIILGIVTFLASNNLIVSLSIILICGVYFFTIGKKKILQYAAKTNKFTQCYVFINTFIVSLSIKQALAPALQTTLETMDDDFKKENSGLDDLKDKEKLEAIGNYFAFDIYYLFLDVVRIWEEQGGDVIDMSNNLTNQLRQIYEYMLASKRLAKQKVVEFSILWSLTLLIMVILRFALSQFFASLSRQLFYPIGIFAIGVFVIVSIHIALLKVTHIDIKEMNKHD